MEDLENILRTLLDKFFSPGELSLLKVFLVGWLIVEFRVRKKYGSLEKVVNKLDQGFAMLQTSFNSMQDTLKDLIKKITDVETSDSRSTVELKERLDRHSSAMSKSDNFLHQISTRLTVVETKIVLLPDETKDQVSP